jgi:uncharacterized phage protein (TIGR02218 family)
MRAASAELIALLNSADTTYFMANCYTITLLNGTVYRCNDVGMPITIGANVFPGSGDIANISGLSYSIKRGLEVDEQTITVAATPAVLIDGQPFLQALAAGLLDDAHFQWERAFLPNWYAPATGSLVLFYGRISTVDKLGRTTAEVKVKSELVLLDRPYPRNYYAAQCGWTLYGYGCGLNRASFSGTATVLSSNLQQINLTSASFTNPVPYVQGTVKFLTGTLAGTSATVKAVGVGPPIAMLFTRPLPSAPAPGTTCQMYWGCDHTTGAQGCAKFSNLLQFRGAPYVPPPSTGL